MDLITGGVLNAANHRHGHCGGRGSRLDEKPQSTMPRWTERPSRAEMATTGPSPASTVETCRVRSAIHRPISRISPWRDPGRPAQGDKGMRCGFACNPKRRSEPLRFPWHIAWLLRLSDKYESQASFLSQNDGKSSKRLSIAMESVSGLDR